MRHSVWVVRYGVGCKVEGLAPPHKPRVCPLLRTMAPGLRSKKKKGQDHLIRRSNLSVCLLPSISIYADGPIFKIWIFYDVSGNTHFLAIFTDNKFRSGWGRKQITKAARRLNKLQSILCTALQTMLFLFLLVFHKILVLSHSVLNRPLYTIRTMKAQHGTCVCPRFSSLKLLDEFSWNSEVQEFNCSF